MHDVADLRMRKYGRIVLKFRDVGGTMSTANIYGPSMANPSYHQQYLHQIQGYRSPNQQRNKRQRQQQQQRDVDVNTTQSIPHFTMQQLHCFNYHHKEQERLQMPGPNRHHQHQQHLTTLTV
jgi:hypothetical protein